MAETLIAVTILLVISVGVVPLFTRSMTNNISGHDSNQASHLARSSLENHLSLVFNDPAFSLLNPQPGHVVQASSTGVGGEEMLLGDEFWDEGASAPGAAGQKPLCSTMDGGTAKTLGGDTECIKLGDAGWITDTTDSRGFVLWLRRSVVRQYTYADISEGVIDQSGNQLVTLGHAHFFDRPLMRTDPASLEHFREHAVELGSERSGADAGVTPGQFEESTMSLGPGSQLTRIVRTF